MNNTGQSPSSRNLSGKTVVIVLGTVAVVLTVIWWIVGGWYMALAVPLGILLVMVLYQAVVWPLFLGALFLVSRLIPKRIKAWVGQESKLTPFASALVVGAALVTLIGIFCLTTKDPKGVLIFTLMVSLVVGFFALIHRVDVTWQTHKAKRKAANQASDATSGPAPSADPSAHQG